MTESRTMFVLMNHRLSEDQITDARESLGVNNIVYAPDDVLKIWGGVPPEMNLWELKSFLRPVFDWLKTSLVPDCLVLVMGESVCTYLVVDAIHMGFYLDNIRCVSTTTTREVTEQTQEDGSVKKISTFRHVRFRAYYA
jgi:hypothetical protein